MPKVIDITGQRFGKLVARSIVGKSPKRQTLWLCQCDCGNATVCDGSLLRNKNTKSCGCLRSDNGRKTIALASDANIRHGHSVGRAKTKEFRAWQAMRNRCNRLADVAYHNYGGRGIKVCERWSSFSNFIADVGEAPSAAHSLDRIDVNGNYEPGNCKWATAKEQAANRRGNRLVEINGETLPVYVAAQKYAVVPLGTFSSRLARGCDPLEAIFTPANHL